LNLKKCLLFVYDFDGVMTDNKVFIDQDGREMVQVSRSDGFAVELLKKKGILQLILSKEKNPVVCRRAEKLKIDVLHGIDDKATQLKLYCKKNDISLDTVLYIGNDLNDIEVMNIVGCKLCPQDAVKEVKNISDLVLSTKGGDGCIRELYTLLAS
jgi:3-deoxy-D-manno-octulosonate 8-phosphate phosphatase (KDO 8-P phosphatase)